MGRLHTKHDKYKYNGTYIAIIYIYSPARIRECQYFTPDPGMRGDLEGQTLTNVSTTPDIRIRVFGRSQLPIPYGRNKLHLTLPMRLTNFPGTV